MFTLEIKDGQWLNAPAEFEIINHSLTFTSSRIRISGSAQITATGQITGMRTCFLQKKGVFFYGKSSVQWQSTI